MWGVDGPVAPEPHDLASRGNGEGALERYARELARSNAELANFASVAAHEMRSPLQVISGFAALLQRAYGANLDERGNEFVEAIVNGAARLDSLIEDLLSYAGVGATELVTETVALGDLVSEVAEWLRPELESRGAQVVWDDLPEVVGDRTQLSQLVQNLIANAAKFTAEGTAPRIEISAERLEGGWAVTVADNGIGITAPERDSVFGMFTRLHPQERYGGTGIGLAICRRVVEGRGGNIWVEPNPGGGSRFRFTIPDRLPEGGAPVELAHEALTDPLTGLANQARLAGQLQRALSRAPRTGELVAVFHIDLRPDHATPPAAPADRDDVRVEVAARLLGIIRGHDTAARILDDELVVLCTGLRGPGDVDTLQQRLAGAFSAPVPSPSGPHSLAPAIGLATSAGADAPEAVIRRARAAAARRGRRAPERARPPQGSNR